MRLIAMILLLGFSGGALAEGDDVPAFEIHQTQFGAARHRLDDHTRVIGWKLADRWYFGRQRGQDSGVAFVWQRDSKHQFSISEDGVRFVRRF